MAISKKPSHWSDKSWSKYKNKQKLKSNQKSETVSLSRNTMTGEVTETRNGKVTKTYTTSKPKYTDNRPKEQQLQAQQTAQYVGTAEEQQIRARELPREQARQDLRFAKARMDKATAEGNHKRAMEINTKEYIPALNKLWVSKFPTKSEVSKKGNELIDYIGSKLISKKTKDKYTRLTGEKETISLSHNIMTGEVTETRTTHRAEKVKGIKAEISQNIQDKDYSSMVKNKFKSDFTELSGQTSHFSKTVVSTIAEIPKSSAQLGVAGASLGVDLIHEHDKYTAEYVGAGTLALGGAIVKGARDDPVGFMGSMVGFSIAQKGIKTIISLPKTIQQKAISGAVIDKTSHVLKDSSVKILKSRAPPKITKGTYATSTSKGNVFIEKIGEKTIKNPLKLADGTLMPKGKYDILQVAGGYMSKRGKAVIKTKGGYVAYVNKNKNVFLSHTKGKAITDVNLFAGRKANFKTVGGGKSSEYKSLTVAKNEKVYSFARHETRINDFGVSKQQPRNIIKSIELKKGDFDVIRLNKGDSTGVRYNLNAPPIKDKLIDRGGVAISKKTGLSRFDVKKQNWDFYISKSKNTVGAKAKTGVFVKSGTKTLKDSTTSSSLKAVEKLDTKTISSIIAPLEKAHTKIAHATPRVLSKTKSKLLTQNNPSTKSVLGVSMKKTQKTSSKSAVLLSSLSVIQTPKTIQTSTNKLYQMSPTKRIQKNNQITAPYSAIRYEQTQPQTQKTNQTIRVSTGHRQKQKQETGLKIGDEIINPIIPLKPENITKPRIKTPIPRPIEEWKIKKPIFGFGSDSDRSFKRSKPSFKFPSFKREKKITPLFGWGAVARFENITGKKAKHPGKSKDEKKKFSKHLRRSGLAFDYEMPNLRFLSKNTKKRFRL